MSETTKSINIRTFCNLQGLGPNDRFVLTKKYKETVQKTYDQWYNELQHQIVLGAKRASTTKKITKK